jgi:hypothetical protein
MRIDPILELGWINLDKDQELTRQLAAKVESYVKENQSQADTRAIFVEPILRGLGWDTLTTKEVSREGQRSYPLGDLWLLAENGSKIAVIIDVKPLTHRNFRERDRRQLEVAVRSLVEAEEGEPENNRKWRLDDGNGKVLLYGILTNGAKWEIYDCGIQKADPASSAISGKLLCKFDLAAAGGGWRDLSSLIGKDAIDGKVREFLLGGRGDSRG